MIAHDIEQGQNIQVDLSANIEEPEKEANEVKDIIDQAPNVSNSELKYGDK